jgi:hypothetical protein
MKNLRFITFLIMSTFLIHLGYAQDNWISDHQAFRDLVVRDVSKFPGWQKRENKYASYFKEFTIKDGLIAEVEYSPTTPEKILSRSNESLQELNQKIRESEIVFYRDCTVIAPVFNIWQREEKDEDSVIGVLKTLYPTDVREGCTVFLEPIIINTYGPVK